MDNKLPTTGKMTKKRYRCKECQNEKEFNTNHWGEFYPQCPRCCKQTTYECLEPVPAGFGVPEKWKMVTLDEIAEINPPPQEPQPDPIDAKYKKYADEGGPLHGLFTVEKVETFHTPHPFCVGSQHVAYAAERGGHVLSEDVIRQSGIGCKQTIGSGRICNEPISKHTIMKCLVLRLVRNLGNKEAATAMFSIKAELDSDKIDGLAMVNLNKEFRIAPPE
jgi:hypothetical protein